MIERVKNDIISRVHKIESGQFNEDDIRLLFINLRDSLDAIKNRAVAGLLYDVFDFCAHPNARNRGDIFKYSRKICIQFVQSIKTGGVVSIETINIQVSQLLASILEALKIPYDEALLINQNNNITLSVFNILNDTELSIKEIHKDDIVESCNVSYDSALASIFISFKLRAFNITRSDNMTITNDGAVIRFRLK